jgi:flavorubredoxin
MAKILILYASRTGETETIAHLIAEGVRMVGAEADVRDVQSVKSEVELEGFDALVLGSATYHGEMLQSMKTFLFIAEKADLQNIVGGAFGAFGWSGEAPDRIFDTMNHIFRMKMVSGPLRLKASSLGGGLQMAQSYGREVAALIG